MGCLEQERKTPAASSAACSSTAVSVLFPDLTISALRQRQSFYFWEGRQTLLNPPTALDQAPTPLPYLEYDDVTLILPIRQGIPLLSHNLVDLIGIAGPISWGSGTNCLDTVKTLATRGYFSTIFVKGLVSSLAKDHKHISTHKRGKQGTILLRFRAA